VSYGVRCTFVENFDPAAVAHGGRDLTPCDTAAGAWRCELRRQMCICRKFRFNLLFFENHDKLNIKKSTSRRKEEQHCYGLNWAGHLVTCGLRN
jgi:hypothetical protein